MPLRKCMVRSAGFELPDQPEEEVLPWTTANRTLSKAFREWVLQEVAAAGG